MNVFKRELKNFILAICAGICIGIGGTVFLASPNNIIGAFLFCVGLLTILVFKFNLYTGMLGYVLDNKPSYLFTVLVVWCGNFVGTALVALLVRLSRLGDALVLKASAVASIKLEDKLISLFILGIFCGILMFVAVDTFKKNAEKKDTLIVYALIMGVMVFIVAGFEHSIADMFYFALAGKLSKCILPLLLISLGNFVGGNIIPAVKKLTEKLA
jgi:formate/nitrite transporter FocA (FNT family)